MRTSSLVGLAVMGMLLSGCTADGSKHVPATRELSEFTYAANGKVYRIVYKYDSLLRAYGIALIVASGPPFTGSEDAEVQNTIRDAFRNQKTCGDLNPGILDFAYAFFQYEGQPAWSAKVRCSETVQKNI